MYRDRKNWNKMSLINTANAGIFSSDETIKRYADEILEKELQESVEKELAKNKK